MEIIPTEIENHLPTVEYQAEGQTDVMEPEQAEKLAENIEEDALSDITLTEEQTANVEETGS